MLGSSLVGEAFDKGFNSGYKQGVTMRRFYYVVIVIAYLLLILGFVVYAWLWQC